jgi:hypothetical protein
MIRESIHGQYHLVDIPFDTSLLHAGRNAITLTLRARAGNLKYVMYDCVRLEVPE